MGGQISATKRCGKRAAWKFGRVVSAPAILNSEKGNDEVEEDSLARSAKSSSLTRHQFEEELRRQFPDADDTSKVAAHLVRAIRKSSRARTDGGDELDLDRLMTALANDDMAKIDWVFDLYDIDGDGVITRKDMLDVATSVERLSPIPGPRSCSPRHQCSALESPVLPRCDSVEARVRKVFDDLDEDRDGRVTRKQFLNVARQDIDLVAFQSTEVALIAASPRLSSTPQVQGRDEIDGASNAGLYVDLLAE